MSRIWLQGLMISLLVHALVLSGGWLWTLLRHPEPPDRPPIRARLVAPEAAPEPPAPDRAQADRPKPDKPEPAKPEPAKPDQPPAPAPDKGTVARPEPESAPEPARPAVKKPAHPVPKKRVAKAEPDKPAPKKEPPEEAPEPKEPAPAKKPDKPEPDKPDPILGQDLADKIAKMADRSDSAKGSLRQRRAVARFQEAVRSRVQSNWLVPPGLDDRDGLTATVRIALTPDGKLASPPKVVSSNGPGYFNSSVVRAVEKAAPFPMPDGPTRYFQNLELHFSPDMVQ